jgi:hypothetical protein
MTDGSLANTVITISNGTYSVSLGLGQTIGRVSQQSKKQLYEQGKPQTKSNWGNAPVVKQNDFLLVSTNFTLIGFIVDEPSKSARTKAYQLEQIFRAGGNFNFTWSNSPRSSSGPTTYSVNVKEWLFEEMAGTTEMYRVTMTLSEGTQR